MRLLLPLFGVLLATGSCCCMGDLNVAPPLPGAPEPPTTPVPKPVTPVPARPPDVPPAGAGTSLTDAPVTSPPHGPPDIPLPPSPRTPTPPAPATPVPTGGTPLPGTAMTSRSGTYEATLLSSNGHTVTITAAAASSSGDPPPVGAAGTLSKWVHKPMFGADVTMWLEIARVNVSAVTASSLTLDVKKVTFDATVNGEKVDPFETGAKLQLVWTQ